MTKHAPDNLINCKQNISNVTIFKPFWMFSFVHFLQVLHNKLLLFYILQIFVILVYWIMCYTIRLNLDMPFRGRYIGWNIGDLVNRDTYSQRWCFVHKKSHYRIRNNSLAIFVSLCSPWCRPCYVPDSCPRFMVLDKFYNSKCLRVCFADINCYKSYFRIRIVLLLFKIHDKWDIVVIKCILGYGISVVFVYKVSCFLPFHPTVGAKLPTHHFIISNISTMSGKCLTHNNKNTLQSNNNPHPLICTCWYLSTQRSGRETLHVTKSHCLWDIVKHVVWFRLSYTLSRVRSG